MKSYYLLFFSLFFLNIYSADLKTKKQVKYHTIECYSYNKKDKLKEGKYLLLDKQSYDTLIIGNYQSDVKTGVWHYKTKKNKDFLVYNYDKNELVFAEKMEVDSFLVHVNGKYILSKVDSPPIYLGYDSEKYSILANYIQLPIQFIDNNLKDYSEAVFVIGKNGKIIHARILKSINSEFDKTVLAGINQLNGLWIPAYVDGKAVESLIHLIVNVAPDNDRPEKGIEKPYIYVVDMIHYTTVESKTRTIKF